MVLLPTFLIVTTTFCNPVEIEPEGALMAITARLFDKLVYSYAPILGMVALDNPL